MKKNSSAEAALHIALLLAALPSNQGLAAGDLARFHDLSQTSIAKLLQQLVTAGLLLGAAGRSGGYRLARPAKSISALDIVTAVEGVAPTFHCNEIRRRGACRGQRASYSPRCTVARVMDQAAEAWHAALARITLADIAAETLAEIDPRLRTLTGAWIAEHAR